MKNENHDSNRRKFLVNSFMGIASLGLADLSLLNSEKPDRKGYPYSIDKKIIYRELGRTKIKIPVVSMGVMNAFFPELIKKSYEIGIRHFDTAANYGNGKSEEGLGSAIKDLKVRDKVIISTKAMYSDLRKDLNEKETKERFLDIFNSSLKRLQMKYVDIMYLHDCSNSDDVNNPGILKAMDILKKSKKIRFTGVTSHRGSVEVINAAVKLDYHDVIQLAFNFTYSGYDELFNALKKANEKGIGLVAMKTQGGGSWWRQIRPNEWDIKDINQTAVLKWVLNNEFISTAIPGYTNYDHMAQNFSVASDLTYNNEEKEFLKKHKALLGMNFCRQCEKCIDSCPKGINIPTLMRTHMYAVQYNNFQQARITYNGLPDTRNIKLCNSCSECTAKCSSMIDISGRIEELKTIYG